MARAERPATLYGHRGAYRFAFPLPPMHKRPKGTPQQQQAAILTARIILIGAGLIIVMLLLGSLRV